jgi:hypothetical protein
MNHYLAKYKIQDGENTHFEYVMISAKSQAEADKFGKQKENEQGFDNTEQLFLWVMIMSEQEEQILTHFGVI